ncbi:hypothetical protein [Sphingomonas sp. CARO-RG-8B-R24-01]|uniref:hypothetical protein n=1 Tax=Sphingomonas sp. CARO-RG-8B-R24-01 TaxID=2914831 RepID=UPI001F59516B|nr:hypothetical protein [Sphingomonas sp. CARO-RG-8B-R24-01]
MANDPIRSERPREDIPESMRNLVQAWQAMASSSAEIANAKRTIFLAYVAEGFSEAQALDLVKTV